MVEEYEEIADSQYLSERMEFLDDDYGKILNTHMAIEDVMWQELLMYYFINNYRS